MEQRKLQPDQAAKRASDGTGYDFLCFDRVEIEQTEEYQCRRDEIDVLIGHLYDSTEEEVEGESEKQATT